MEGMITIAEPAKRSFIKRQAPSSVGFLDRLPLEILHLTFNLLDFQSLSYFSRTSLQGKTLVESLPAYRDLMQYAPRTLKALGQTGLLHFHPAATIYQAMQSKACISCGEYGAFLFLLTCQRCCYHCLCDNTDLWLISSSLARKCFSLTSNDLKHVPTLHSIPGTYTTDQKSRRQRLRLINVKQARELEPKLRGRIDALGNSRMDIRSFPRGMRSVLFRCLRKEPVRIINQDLSTVMRDQVVHSDDFEGMGSIPFPSLSPTHGIDYGLWCYGCKWMFNNIHLKDPLLLDVIADITPAGVKPSRILFARQNRARSKSEFLQHVHDCYGAQKRMANPSSRFHTSDTDPDHYATLG
ncbi:F-box domain-containing protein [Penicillium lagena]|uniref:F-box domain-containing protein n=1 Tax=Penicillium lagena TaxID=94218 RepID=UPI00253FDDEF|nr:F-box domain-containing protein [Penicillium lagena]KAJ5618916.1 F-box domain-containing protein [Penicillium lagena]